MKRACAAALAAVLWAQPVWADPAAEKAATLPDLKAAAAAGGAEAENRLGLAYFNGEIVKQDFVQARQWFEKAAAQGYRAAEYNLGVIYDDGDGVAPDAAQAFATGRLRLSEGRCSDRTPSVCGCFSG